MSIVIRLMGQVSAIGANWDDPVPDDEKKITLPDLLAVSIRHICALRWLRAKLCSHRARGRLLHNRNGPFARGLEQSGVEEHTLKNVPAKTLYVTR